MTRHCAIKTEGVGSVLVKLKFRWLVFWLALYYYWPFKQFQLKTELYES